MADYVPDILEEKYKSEIVEFAQHEEEKLCKLNSRLYCEGSPSSQERDRNQYWRDYARILYSSSFRRLQGKMQLLGVDQTSFYRNRLTHSLEVAQIARGIANKLQLKNPIVAEACSLAHDIGNPPFGHFGETVLNRKVSTGYEGNAQTLRTLMHLEKKNVNHGGLNLTLRTLFGVVKYNNRGIYDERKKNSKYIYEEDYDALRAKVKAISPDTKIERSIDVQIMDLADEIAYAAHDLEDSLSAGHFTIYELINEFDLSKEQVDSKNDFSKASKTLHEIVDKCRETANFASRLGSSEEFAFIFRKELTSILVNRLINDIGVVEEGTAQELGYKEDEKLARGLKKLIFKSVLRKSDVHLYEKQGEKIIEGLFEVYSDKSYNDQLRLMPPEYRHIAEKDGLKRAVADYIGGMQDSFAVQEYQRHFGKASLESPFTG